MRWKGRRQSRNIEDRRRARGPRVAVGGGVDLLLIILVVVLLGGNPQALLSGLNTGLGSAPAGPAAPQSRQEQELAQFVSVVLADTEDVWDRIFAARGQSYRDPKLILFTDQVRSACGFASAASGPFYCPPDEKVYIDLAFFEELGRRFNAPGDFAQAYVIAHEVGHHVQKLLGLTERVHAQRGRVSQTQYNDLSVRLELQADFLAGVWAHHADRSWQILEPGDIEEALGAAAAVGDDRIQTQTRGRVVPDSFTHGSSRQRMRWFMLGLETGDLARGDTFGVANP